MSHTSSWDVYGRPVTIDSVTLTYDALGRMVKQNRSGTYTQFVYSPTGQKMQIMNGQAATKSLVALPAGGVAVLSSAGQYYYHPDHLGSSRLISTSNRIVYFDGAYAPFGEPYAQSGTTDLSFTGQNQDTVAGLYDFPAREYSYQGSWPSPDPAGSPLWGLGAVDPSNPQSWNRYAYVLNNPLALTDPTGLVCNGGDQTTWDTLADGTGIFTQDDCIASGGTWEGDAAGTIITPPTYVTADPGNVPWGPNVNGLLIQSSGGGGGSGSGKSTGGGNNLSTLKILFTTNPFPTAWKSLTSENGCGHTIAETFLSDLSPVPLDTTPGITDAIEPTTKFTNVTSAALAIRYASGQTNVLGGIGLIKPFASRTFRGLWSISKFAEEVALPATIVLSGVDALARAGTAAYNGTCQ